MLISFAILTLTMVLETVARKHEYFQKIIEFFCFDLAAPVYEPTTTTSPSPPKEPSPTKEPSPVPSTHDASATPSLSAGKYKGV